MAEYGSFARQLMESKRRSKLTGRQDTASRYALSDWQLGAPGRVANSRQIKENNALRAQSDAFAAQLANAKQDYTGGTSFQMPTFQAPEIQMPDYSSFYATLAAQQKKQDDDWAALQYKMKFPNSEILDPSDPRLQGIAQEPQSRGTLAPGPALVGPGGADVPAQFTGVPYGTVNNPAWEEYQNYLRMLYYTGPGGSGDVGGGAVGNAPGGLSGMA